MTEVKFAQVELYKVNILHNTTLELLQYSQAQFLNLTLKYI